MCSPEGCGQADGDMCCFVLVTPALGTFWTFSRGLVTGTRGVVWGRCSVSRQEEDELCGTAARNPQDQRAPEARMKAGAWDRYCPDEWAKSRKGLAFPTRKNDLIRIFFFLSKHFTLKEKGSATTQSGCSSLSSMDAV